MADLTWSTWNTFHNATRGDFVEAPIGPGVYEVRHAPTGALIAFGHSGNVAGALADIKVDGGEGGWKSLFRKALPKPNVMELEYRTYPTASRSEARTAAARLKSLRQSYWRNRMDAGMSARHG